MSEQPAVPAVTQIVIPPKPRPTRELEIEADMAVRYLEQFTRSDRLDPDLRMAMTGMGVFCVGVMVIAVKAGIAQEARMTSTLNGYVDQLNALVEMSQVNAL